MSVDQSSSHRGSPLTALTARFNSVAMAPYGLFLLRVAIGIDWIAHAFLKTTRGMNTHEALLAKNGITPLLAWRHLASR
jgi:putative oxidoreductase